MQPLVEVLDGFRASRLKLNNRAIYTSSEDQVSLLETLPAFFRNLITERNRSPEFDVVGSIGNGNLANVPWVAVFNKKVTRTAQEGYYIVLLFAEDMSCCYLSLNQGVTSFQNLYSRRLGIVKMVAASKKALSYFQPHPIAIRGTIDLKATGRLGEGYEYGAIESFRYERENLPDSFQLAEDFFTLLAHYDTLVPIAGATMQTLVPVNETEFQQVALERAASNADFLPDNIEPSNPVPRPVE